MAECAATPQEVAEQLNTLGEANEGLSDVTLCGNGCFNLEGWIISPRGRARQVDSAESNWFEIGSSRRYRAAEITAAFPMARQDCPGARPRTD
jgi:hypothetical protein